MIGPMRDERGRLLARPQPAGAAGASAGTTTLRGDALLHVPPLAAAGAPRPPGGALPPPRPSPPARPRLPPAGPRPPRGAPPPPGPRPPPRRRLSAPAA